MYVAGICRPSNNPIADITHFITNTLEHADNRRTIFAGDFTIYVLSNSNVMRNYVDTFHRYGLTNEISLPTYDWPSTGIDISSFDHFWHSLLFFS